MEKVAQKKGKTLDLSSGSNARKMNRTYRVRQPGEKRTPKSRRERSVKDIDG